jgi:hypothetical protein
MAQPDNVDTTAVALFGASLAIIGIGIYFSVWLLFGYFNSRQAAANAGAIEYPLAASQETRLPPEPRLQIDPRGDLRAMRDEEDKLLESYQWVDKNAGVVRIPIEQAMKLTIQRGLPARPAAQGKQ